MASVAQSGGGLRDGVPRIAVSSESIEERCFSAALIILEGHYTSSPPMGPLTAAKVASMVSKTLEKTHQFTNVREALSRNVPIWIYLTRIFASAVPNLTSRSVGPLLSSLDPDKGVGVTPQESTALIVRNFAGLKDDLQVLNKLMHIARNLLVTSEPEVPQDLCAAVHFDQMVYQTIILCVNVTSKGYDGEVFDETSRQRLTEVTELYKKLLVTSLQQAHNWTAKNDRNKMSFWFDVLFDDEPALDDQDLIGDGSGFRIDVAKTEVQHWLERNSRMCDTARGLLRDYAQNHADKPPGPLAPISPLAWNWLPDGTVKIRADDPDDTTAIKPYWDDREQDKFEQDRAYSRVSREIDTWWLRVRDANYEDWVDDMPSVQFAEKRTDECKASLLHRYFQPEDRDRSVVDLPDEMGQVEAYGEDPHPAMHDYPHEYDDHGEEEDIDDDESYGEGPMSGLLTEVPNILDPKQIEALHMIVKSCILDTAGSGLTRAGENLQKTRCRMLLALDCGKSLLREMLVFIAVWEKDEQSLIFQITTQIVEALHHSALVPYTWNSLRIPKDIMSPAQTVLLRLVNHMFRARSSNPPAQESKENVRDVKLVYFFFSILRRFIVPECVALMYLQAQIRSDICDPADFPVDNWDMERARDGLAQFLDFLTTVTEIPEMRAKLIEWEAAYDLITLLKGLEAGVPKKPLVDLPARNNNRAETTTAVPTVERPYSTDDAIPEPPPPPMQDPPHKFPWAGVKGQMLVILAGLLQPPLGRNSPGNAQVQEQIMRHNGIVSLLNCCVYDDHNRFARERVQICLKWLLDGCEAAGNFLKELVAMSPQQPNPAQAAAAAPRSLRVDGIQGEVQVQVRSRSAPVGEETSVADVQAPANAHALEHGAPRSRSEELLRDIINLADETARMALAHRDEEETEDDDFM